MLLYKFDRTSSYCICYSISSRVKFYLYTVSQSVSNSIMALSKIVLAIDLGGNRCPGTVGLSRLRERCRLEECDLYPDSATSSPMRRRVSVFSIHLQLIQQSGIHNHEFLSVLHQRLLNRLDTRLPPSCLLYTSPSPRDRTRSRMPSSA